MEIAVKAVCSECAYSEERSLRADEKELLCPVCGRRMPNIKREEIERIEKIQKSQRLMNGLSIGLFVIAAILVGVWAGSPSTWVSTDTVREANIGAMAGALVCAVAALVCGILASRKRFVLEY